MASVYLSISWQQILLCGSTNSHFVEKQFLYSYFTNLYTILDSIESISNLNPLWLDKNFAYCRLRLHNPDKLQCVQHGSGVFQIIITERFFIFRHFQWWNMSWYFGTFLFLRKFFYSETMTFLPKIVRVPP